MSLFDTDCLWTSLIRFDSRWLILNNVMFTCIYCKNNKKVWITLCEIHLVLCFSCRKPAILHILSHITCLLSGAQLWTGGRSWWADENESITEELWCRSLKFPETSSEQLNLHIILKEKPPLLCSYGCSLMTVSSSPLGPGWVLQHLWGLWLGWWLSGTIGSTLVSVTAQDIFKEPFLAEGEWTCPLVLK